MNGATSANARMYFLVMILLPAFDLTEKAEHQSHLSAMIQIKIQHPKSAMPICPQAHHQGIASDVIDVGVMLGPSLQLALQHPRSIRNPVAGVRDDPVSRRDAAENLGDPIIAVTYLNRSCSRASVPHVE